MAGTKPNPNMDRRSTAQWKRQQTVEKGLALTRMNLVSSSAVPSTHSTGPRIWESLKLPSLTNMTHPRTPGIIEPALFIPVQRPMCETFSYKFCPSSKKPTSPLPCESTDRPPLACRPVYTHFCLPIRPLPRLNHVARPARSLNSSQCSLRPLVKEEQSPGCQVENLSINGVSCFSRDFSTKGPKQLHVFLPTAEEYDKDSESVDEGFMDEVDHRAVLKQQERKPKKLT